MSEGTDQFNLREIALAAFLPTLLFSIGEGAIIPIIPVVASNLGANIALASLVGALVMLGTVVGDLPSGWVVAKLGERNAMIYSALLCIGALVVCLLSPTVIALAIGVFLIGMATTVFALARHAFMTTYVPLRYRARALSTLGGLFRGGWFVGPLTSAFVISAFGDTHLVFWIHIGACVATIIVLLAIPDPTVTVAKRMGVSPASLKPKMTENLFKTLWHYRGTLARMGFSAALVNALRSSRVVILPLVAVAIGISDSNTALIIGIAGGVDFALFYTSGQIMDRFGRTWAAVPSMIGLAISHLALAFVTTEPWFIAVAIAMAVANGISSGLIMTLGADLAPQKSPAPFLGAWRFMSDSGQASAPLLISGITAAVSLTASILTIGVIGVGGTILLVRWVPRYIPGPRSKKRQRNASRPKASDAPIKASDQDDTPGPDTE